MWGFPASIGGCFSLAHTDAGGPRPGAGAFCVPVGATPPRADRPSPPPPPGRAGLAAGREAMPHRPAVLIIDDDHALRDLIAEVLAEEGYRVAGVDGAAALAALRRERPGLLLLDVRMTGLDGTDLCRQL